MNNTTATNFAPQPAFFTFKVYFKPGNQVRRLRFATNINLSEFKTIVSQLGQSVPQTEQTSTQYNSSQPPVVVVQYLDEENDWISVTSEEEWREALHQHSVLSRSLGQQENNLFRVKFITLPKKPETVFPAATSGTSSSSSGRTTCRFSLPQSSSSLCRRETWEPYIEQVKESGKKMQPYLSQAKDIAVENAKKVQELVTDRQKQQDLKQWFRQWFEKLMSEGQETQQKLGEWLKEFDNFVDSLSTSTTVTTTTSTSSADPTTTWYNTTAPPPYHHTRGGEEEIMGDQEDEDGSSDDYVVVVNEPLLPESAPSQPVWQTSPEHASMYPETTAPEHTEENEEEHQLHQQEPQQQQKQENLESTIPEEYVTKLDSLLDMGFTDRELNLILLKQNNGDLVKVVSELLTASM